MKKFPPKPKKPIILFSRYYNDVIKEVKEKYPNKGKISGFYRLVIKEMFQKLDINEKKNI